MGIGDLECYHVLYGLAAAFRPRSYLEIGVREGASICCVLAREVEIVDFAMNCLVEGLSYIDDEIVERVAESFTNRNREMNLYLFENWSYGGGEGGHKRLVSLLEKGFNHGKYQIFDGDSKETLPKFFDEHQDKIDLAFIDGDHSVEGAWTDLNNVCDRFKILVFHDLFHPQHSYLTNVFRQFVVSHDFPHLILGRKRFGVGVAFDLF